MKAIFGWDYNTWCRCQYYGGFGNIGENFIKHHLRKIDTRKKCFVCTKLGHLAKNCMNRGRVKDEKKAKADNIRKKMRQQWVQKSLENASQSTETIDTQVKELSGTITST